MELLGLQRFVLAQEVGNTYEAARAEILAGRKYSHWIWYIFPQIAGLGLSHMSREYAIASIEEAHAYLLHPVLGRRLREITALANLHAPASAHDIFGRDDVKFHSCVTLFSRAMPDDSVFGAALDLFFDGVLDKRTEKILEAQATMGAFDRREFRRRLQTVASVFRDYYPGSPPEGQPGGRPKEILFRIERFPNVLSLAPVGGVAHPGDNPSGTCTLDGAVDELWLDGRVPLWISVAQVEQTDEVTILRLECRNRFTDRGDLLYFAELGSPPFDLNPVTPLTNEMMGILTSNSIA